MVGFDPYASVELSTFEYGAAGVVSGVLSRAICQPLDVLKVRFQLQLLPISKTHPSGGKYTSMWQATKMIVKEESLGALWKGHIPSQCLSMVYGTIQFGSFEFLTKRIWLALPEPLLLTYAPFANFICGGLAGCLAMTGSFPFDVIRTRLIAQGHPRTYRSMTHAIRMISVIEGPRGFYRGFLPNLMNIGPYSGLTFAFYRWFVTIWARIPFDRIYNNKKTTTTGATSGNNNGVMETFVCGCFAGASAKMCVYPFDLLKKRLQMIGFEQARKGTFGDFPHYMGMFHCLFSVWKYEGFLALFKGLSPSLIKAAAASGFGFLFYEQTCRILRYNRQVTT